MQLQKTALRDCGREASAHNPAQGQHRFSNRLPEQSDTSTAEHTTASLNAD